MLSAVSKPFAAITRAAMSSVVIKPWRVAESIHTEPPQLVANEVGRPLGIGALWLDLVRVAVGLEQPQYAVDMREVRAVLFELAFKLFDDPGNDSPLLAQCGNDV